jgi:hypothetical protein
MAASIEFDSGNLEAYGGALAHAGVRAGAASVELVERYGVILQARVKSRAAGRPGPRMQTGDYNRSIGLTIRRSPTSTTAVVATNKPQGPRLELGFDDVDSLGRSYNQPAFPHFGPAGDETAPEFVAAVGALGFGVVADSLRQMR